MIRDRTYKEKAENDCISPKGSENESDSEEAQELESEALLKLNVN